jgi:succinate dehydrogenase/fumarate reductase flavoprotein subunit
MRSGDNPHIVIAGAGMAGLVAAVQAQALGAQVTLVEKGAAPGGSLALSGGTLWCAKTYADLRCLVPRGDPDLGRVLVEEYPAGVAWLQEVGATLTPLPSLPDRAVYLMAPSPRHFVAQMVDQFTRRGGILLTHSAGVGLVTDTHAAVTGLTVRTATGQPQTLAAHAVILTTGGFQANPDLTARYFGRWTDRLILRSNPHSTGDGLWLGTIAGAATSRAMSSFYGHLLPAPPAVVPVDDFIAYTHYHSEQAILVNLRGERFTDESLGDETNCQAVAREPEALAFILYDETVYRTYAVRPAGGGARASDTFHESKALGAPAAQADTLEALVAALAQLGVYGPGVRATIQEYNAAIAAGRAGQLRIPRRAKANPIRTPPFYALGLTPGITFTLGGLRINTHAQVLDRSQRPIAGLYAAGADAGGIHNEQYAGGLCLGLVFGRRAAHHAVNFSNATKELL